MNTVSTIFPNVPTTGSLSSSFLPTPVQLSLSKAAEITGSKLLRWLKMNTAGRFWVRLSRPSTLMETPLAASSSCGKAVVNKLTPRRLLRVSSPQLIAVVAAGTSAPMPSRVRTCPITPPLPRLLNCRIGQPRRRATEAILPSGLVGRGLPTRYISATSSSPSA